jgi:hypothetical protein
MLMSLVNRPIRTAAMKAATLSLLTAAILVAQPRDAHAQIAYNQGNTMIATQGSTSGVFASWWDSVVGNLSFRLTTANVAGQGGIMSLLLPDLSSPSTGFVSGASVPASREWDVHFSYYAGSGSGADGLAFVVITRNGLTSPSTGGGLGFTGTEAFAIEFDTFDNGGGENGIQAMLSAPGISPIPVSANVRPAFSLRGHHRVLVTCRFRNFRPPWDNRDRIISVYMDSIASPVLTTWIPSTYLRTSPFLVPTFGFTAATGGLADEHMISWDWQVTAY